MELFTPIEYLQIDIANSYGLDKLEWRDRLAWFLMNEHHLESQVKDAKEPAMYLAGVKAYRSVLKGNPSGYPISLDSTASGLQWMAALTHDRGAAELTNLIDTGKRVDAYTALYQSLQKACDLTGVSRDDTKYGIMTSLYASESVPQAVFGDYVEDYYSTMKREVPLAWQLNTLLIEAWDPQAIEHKWTMPDGFDVEIPIFNTKKQSFTFKGEIHEFYRKTQGAKKKGRSLGANLIHSVDSLAARELVRRCNYEPTIVARALYVIKGMSDYYGHIREVELGKRLLNLYRQSGFMSVRILSAINTRTLKLMTDDEIEIVSNIIKSLPTKPFEILTTHDCFRVLPSYGNDLRQQYKEIVIQVCESELLNHILDSIANFRIEIKERITKDISCNYAIC